MTTLTGKTVVLLGGSAALCPGNVVGAAETASGGRVVARKRRRRGGNGKRQAMPVAAYVTAGGPYYGTVAVHPMTNSALTGVTYGIDGGQQLVPRS
jgi:hypothetical protein